MLTFFQDIKIPASICKNDFYLFCPLESHAAMHHGSRLQIQVLLNILSLLHTARLRCDDDPIEQTVWALLTRWTVGST